MGGERGTPSAGGKVGAPVYPHDVFALRATREEVLAALRSGADGYITKPFHHEALVKGVGAVLGVGS